jgi:hypothetical protein
MSSEDQTRRAAAPDPPFVVSEADRLRWALCVGVANAIFADTGDPAAPWFAARSLFHSNLPTCPPDARQE